MILSVRQVHHFLTLFLRALYVSHDLVEHEVLRLHLSIEVAVFQVRVEVRQVEALSAVDDLLLACLVALYLLVFNQRSVEDFKEVSLSLSLVGYVLDWLLLGILNL